MGGKSEEGQSSAYLQLQFTYGASGAARLE
jgi:hypothetical protein